MLDSRVSGGPSGAASGKMAIWVGSDEQIFNRHKRVFDAVGGQAAYISAGTIAKLVHNCTSAVMGVALAEVFTMGIKAGVEPLELWEAVRQGATGRQRTFGRLGRFLSGKHDPADFALRLDVGLAVGLGREVGVPMRLANMAFEELTEAMNRGWGTATAPSANYCRSSAPASRRRPSIRTRCKQSATSTLSTAQEVGRC
jgi:3-hydroxyisobutyrate dehydrogenase-like beta-hydroxyacid dehydrogenase